MQFIFFKSEMFELLGISPAAKLFDAEKFEVRQEN